MVDDLASIIPHSVFRHCNLLCLTHRYPILCASSYYGLRIVILWFAHRYPKVYRTHWIWSSKGFQHAPDRTPYILHMAIYFLYDYMLAQDMKNLRIINSIHIYTSDYMAHHGSCAM